jgi:oxygen-independent coproporphyrinogen-3 oxidase
MSEPAPYASTLRRDGKTSPVRSLYVHVPFCHTICGYCDFYSVVYDRQAAHPLVDALIAELSGHARQREFALETIFVGGGTPTTLPTADLQRLLSAIRDCGKPETGFEWTCEANPATVTPEVAETLVSAGVNRISIGAQSFNRSELRVLERIHKPEQVIETVRHARAAGIRQVNVDLIFAVPGQSLASWLDNLRQAIDLGVDHLSCYALTYEPGTPLFDRLQQGGVTRIDNDLEAEMFEATVETLDAAGLQQYEVSNFARPGAECRHNLVYWRNEPYLGVGPSASGWIDGVRYKNVSDHQVYGRAIRSGHSPWIEHESRDRIGAARDALLMGLRLIAGLDRAAFSACYGADPADLFPEATRRHAELGLLELTPDRMRLTRPGLLLADAVIAEFL